MHRIFDITDDKKIWMKYRTWWEYQYIDKHLECIDGGYNPFSYVLTYKYLR